MRSLEMEKIAKSEVKSLKDGHFVTAERARKSVSALRTAANRGMVSLKQIGTSDEELEKLVQSHDS